MSGNTGQMRMASRRTVLAAAAIAPLATLAACGSDDSGQPDPDDAVKSSVAAAEAALIGQYDAAISAFPALEPKLGPIRDQHKQHLAAMDAGSPSPTSSSVNPTSSSAAIAQLTAAERKAAVERTKSCVDATAQQLAWTLSLIASSEASHAAYLSGGA